MSSAVMRHIEKEARLYADLREGLESRRFWQQQLDFCQRYRMPTDTAADMVRQEKIWIREIIAAIRDLYY